LPGYHNPLLVMHTERDGRINALRGFVKLVAQ
jgi:hypothetical protein